jgi:hypothetical protein
MTARPDAIVTIEAWLVAEALDRAPQRLLDDTRERVRTSHQRRRRPGPWALPRLTRVRAAVAVAGVMLLAVVSLHVGLLASGVIGPMATPTPAPSSTPQPSGSTAPAPSPVSTDLIQWSVPGPRGGRAGRYAWVPGDPGWMHNPGNGPGVDLSFTVLQARVRRDPTNVLVAGHVASYEEHPNATGGLTRLWVVEIDGTTIAIRVESSADTVESDIAEAQAIVASIRVEQDTNALGFMLSFLSPGGWDSG